MVYIHFAVRNSTGVNRTYDYTVSMKDSVGNTQYHRGPLLFTPGQVRTYTLNDANSVWAEGSFVRNSSTSISGLKGDECIGIIKYNWISPSQGLKYKLLCGSKAGSPDQTVSYLEQLHKLDGNSNIQYIPKSNELNV